MNLIFVILIQGILMLIWGGIALLRGRIRLTHRTQFQGSAARLISVILILLGTAILATVYWIRLCCSTMGDR